MRLERTVAIKVLPPHLSAQSDLRDRLEREARTISSLNHPHICTLFDVGSHEGTAFLVMEYLEGETLEQRLQKGALPLDIALKYGIEIADALDKAHRSGIVHRDLKPANVMITKSGTKLLDFGLAKVSTAPIEGNMPTNLTAQGTILGTLQYMSPEQLEGQEAGARTDIFAFGSILYQMVCGQTAFQGKSQATLIAAIISNEPPAASTRRPGIPPLLDHIIRRCLAKDPDECWQTASDLMRELQWIAIAADATGETVAPGVSSKTNRLWMVLASVMFLAAAAMGVVHFTAPVPETIPLRLSIVSPPNTSFATGSGGAPWPTLSPDGRRLVFGAVSNEKRFLWLQNLDSDRARLLPGTEGASQPFWSPDGRFVAFFALGKLKRIDPSGGSPQTICDVQGDREGTWGPDGTIVFSGGFGAALLRVSASGGEPRPLTQIDKSRGESGHLYPGFLPDGRHFLFLAQGSDAEQSSISVGSLDSKDVVHLLNLNTKARYAAPGFLLYMREDALVAQPFDAKRLQLTGDAVPVADSVRHTTTTGIAAFSVSNNGSIAYRAGDRTELSRFTWFDRSGRVLQTIGEHGVYSSPELSPDGKFVAFTRWIDEGNRDIWILELARGIFTRFTSSSGSGAASDHPHWSSNGERILFSTLAKGHRNMVVKSVSGATPDQSLETGDAAPIVPTDWTRDGKYLVLAGGRGPRDHNWVWPVDGSEKPRRFLNSNSVDIEGKVSPDGRWILYTSNDSGRFEVSAERFPTGGEKIQISLAGGSKPRWRRDGREVYYLSPDPKIMAVSVQAGDKSLEVSSPTPLFNLPVRLQLLVGSPFGAPYDVTTDGKRFLVALPADTQDSIPVTIFTGWQTSLMPKK